MVKHSMKLFSLCSDTLLINLKDSVHLEIAKLILLTSGLCELFCPENSSQVK